MITVPLKAVMAVLFVVIAAVAVIVAFVPTTLVGISSNEDTGKKLQRTTSDYVTQSITTLLSTPTNIYSSLQDLQRTGRIDATILTPTVIDTAADLHSIAFLDDIKDQMNAYRSGSLAAAAAMAATTSMSTTSITNVVSNVFAYVPHSRRLYGAQDYVGNTEFRSVYSEFGLNATIYDSNNVPVSSLFYAAPNVVDNVAYYGFLRFILTLTDDSVHCSPGLLLTYYGGGIVCGFRYVDPRNATKDVYVGMTITSATISQQISLISATENTLTTVLMAATKEVVGLSWGEDIESHLDQYDDSSASYELRIRLKAATEIQHPTVQAALAALGGPSGLDGRTYPYRFSIGSGRDEIYGDLNIYQDNITGLSMYVLVTMPKDDFLGTIYRTTYLIAGIVCGACVLLMVIGVVFAYCLVRPLDELGERMHLTASFKDDGTHSSTPSRMSEINQLQASFETMRDQLNTMKAYLPQSVLEALRGTSMSNSDSDDEGANDDLTTIPSCGSSLVLSHVIDVVENIETTSTTAAPVGLNGKKRRSTPAASGVGAVTATLKSKDKSVTNNPILRFTASLASKTVTVVAFNLRNTHSTWGRPQSSVPGVQERYLSVILARCQENRGVVDTFQGDRVIASFNAVRSCAQSGRRAVQVALEVVALCARSNTIKSSVTAGVASGRALVGNSGAAEMMKFNVIGPVVGEAVALERCARVATSNQAQFVRPGEADTLALRQFRNTTPVYLHSGFEPLVSELENHFTLQPIDIVRRKLVGKTAVDGSEQVVLLAPHPRPKGASDEWMYELADKGVEAPLLQLFEWFNELIAANLNNSVALIKESLRSRVTTLLEATETKPRAGALEELPAASPTEEAIAGSLSQNVGGRPGINSSQYSDSNSQNNTPNISSARNSIASGLIHNLQGSTKLASSTVFGAVNTSPNTAVASSSTQLLSILDRCNINDDDGTAMWLCS